MNWGTGLKRLKWALLGLVWALVLIFAALAGAEAAKVGYVIGMLFIGTVAYLVLWGVAGWIVSGFAKQK